MSFSPRNDLIARTRSAALVWPDRSTWSNALSASWPQCQVSSNALDLRSRLRPSRGAEQDVVVGLRVEWRVQVDQVHALARYAVSQHIQVVAVIEGIGHQGAASVVGLQASPTPVAAASANRHTAGLRRCVSCRPTLQAPQCWQSRFRAGRGQGLAPGGGGPCLGQPEAQQQEEPAADRQRDQRAGGRHRPLLDQPPR